MKFSCDKNLIFTEISNSRDFTSQKTAESQFSYVKLEVENDCLTIKTTDQKMGFYSVIKVDNSEDGIIMVKCEKFLEVLRTLPNSIINFTTENNSLIIQPVDSKIKVNLFTFSNVNLPFPTIPSNDEFFNISQSLFTKMVNSVIFAVSEDESKYNMTGVYFEVEDDSLIMVATDSRRLSYASEKIEDKLPDFDGITIPTKFLNVIKKQAEDEGEFGLCVKTNTLFIKNAGSIYFSNLISEDFPAFRRVIPTTLKFKCVINKEMLENAVKRCATVIDDNKFKKIIIEIKEDLLIVSTEDNTSIGSVHEEIPCDYKGEDIKFGINYSYVLSPFKIIDSEEVSIEFTSVLKPFIFKTVPENDSFHLVMPMGAAD